MLIIGHRGAKGLAPENTMASLQAALDNKVDGVEFDVRITKDNVPVLHHNSDIGKSGRDLDIAKTELKELQALKPDLTTLQQAMDLLQNKSTVVIEIKTVRSVQPIVKILEECLSNGWRPENISVSSFSYRTLRQIKQSLPPIRLIVNEAWSGVRAGRRAKRLGTKFITMNQKWLWGGFIRAVIRRGYKLSAYTINNPTKAARWQKYGLHAAITDFPDRFQEI